MADFTSEEKNIPYNNGDIFNILSNLNNLELIKDRLPEEEFKKFTFDADSCSITVDPIGSVRFVIAERIPNSLIKLVAEQVPFDVALRIEIDEIDVATTKLKVVVDANLNPFIKPMVAKPLQQGIDRMADMLAVLPYNEILNKGTLAQ